MTICNRHSRCWFALVAFTAIIVTSSTLADPATVSYQAYLTNSSGSPINETVEVATRIYSVVGGTLLYEESHGSVSVDSGLFSIAIGDGTPVSGTFGPSLFGPPSSPVELEIVINGETLAPRRPLRSVPHAQDAQALGGVEAEGFLQLDETTEQSVSDGSLSILPASQSVSTEGEYQYTTPKTYTYAVTPPRFIPVSNANTFWTISSNGLWGYSEETITTTAFAGVNLPEGANVQKLTCYFYDNNPFATVSIFLAELSYWNTGEVNSRSTIAVFSTDSSVPNTSPSVRTASATIPGQVLPPGAPAQIRLAWLQTTAGDSLRFYGCDIEYTLDKVSST